MSKVEQQKWLEAVKDFEPKKRGKTGYFLKDEEELFVITLKEAFRSGFPYDVDMLELMTSKSGRDVYGEQFSVGRYNSSGDGVTG